MPPSWDGKWMNVHTIRCMLPLCDFYFKLRTMRYMEKYLAIFVKMENQIVLILWN